MFVGCYGALLTDFVSMLVSRIGGVSGVGFRPFVVHPPSCRGGGFHTTEQFMGCPSYWCCVVIFGSCFNTVSNILLLFDVCLSLIWLPATVPLYMW